MAKSKERTVAQELARLTRQELTPAQEIDRQTRGEPTPAQELASRCNKLDRRK